MSTYRLASMFAPRSIALVGVGSRANAVGRIVLANLRASGFRGAIHIVHQIGRAHV